MLCEPLNCEPNVVLALAGDAVHAHLPLPQPLHDSNGGLGWRFSGRQNAVVLGSHNPYILQIMMVSVRRQFAGACCKRTSRHRNVIFWGIPVPQSESVNMILGQYFYSGGQFKRLIRLISPKRQETAAPNHENPALAPTAHLDLKAVDELCNAFCNSLRRPCQYLVLHLCVTLSTL